MLLRFSWLMVLFSSSISLLIFCLVVLLTDEGEMLKSSVIIEDLSISPSSSISYVLSHVLQLLCFLQAPHVDLSWQMLGWNCTFVLCCLAVVKLLLSKSFLLARQPFCGALAGETRLLLGLLLYAPIGVSVLPVTSKSGINESKRKTSFVLQLTRFLAAPSSLYLSEFCLFLYNIQGLKVIVTGKKKENYVYSGNVFLKNKILQKYCLKLQ